MIFNCPNCNAGLDFKVVIMNDEYRIKQRCPSCGYSGVSFEKLKEDDAKKLVESLAKRKRMLYK